MSLSLSPPPIPWPPGWAAVARTALQGVLGRGVWSLLVAVRGAPSAVSSGPSPMPSGGLGRSRPLFGPMGPSGSESNSSARLASRQGRSREQVTCNIDNTNRPRVPWGQRHCPRRPGGLEGIKRRGMKMRGRTGEPADRGPPGNGERKTKPGQGWVSGGRVAGLNRGQRECPPHCREPRPSARQHDDQCGKARLAGPADGFVSRRERTVRSRAPSRPPWYAALTRAEDGARDGTISLRGQVPTSSDQNQRGGFVTGGPSALLRRPEISRGRWSPSLLYEGRFGVSTTSGPPSNGRSA